MGRQRDHEILLGLARSTPVVRQQHGEHRILVCSLCRAMAAEPEVPPADRPMLVHMIDCPWRRAREVLGIPNGGCHTRPRQSTKITQEEHDE